MREMTRGRIEGCGVRSRRGYMELRIVWIREEVRENKLKVW